MSQSIVNDSFLAATDQGSGFRDVFISYGRKESKVFARRILEGLAEQGIHAWYDQNDIPLATDFQEEINRAIDRSHNFVFIIAPHAVNSPYCLLEVERAVSRRKRIIPILHIEEGWDISQLHPSLQKLNWIYMREKRNPDQPQEAWAPIDDFGKGLTGLVRIVREEEPYIKQGTVLLQKAIEWEKHQKSTTKLLVGEERKQAEAWLLKKFEKQSPCEPCPLQSEFIMDSRKNGENLMTDVFIAYDIAQKSLREEVNRALWRNGVTTWVHDKDIEKGENFEKAIDAGIEQADNFIFFISKDSIESEWCLKELKYAHSLNKRIIPLLIEQVPTKSFPEILRPLQYIDFTDNVEAHLKNPEEKSDFEKDIDDILREINRDTDYYEHHKQLLVQALKWKGQNENNAVLLRGHQLDKAKIWLETGKRKEHKPTALHEEFIYKSISLTGMLQNEVFLSYSRNDGDFARKLNNELQANGKTTWFDQESIPPGSDFQKEIFNGIESSEIFLFVISPASIRSEFCAGEVDHAVRHGKKMVTLLLRPVEVGDLPPALGSVQWIDFSQPGKFDDSMRELMRTLSIDREHVQQHTKWQQRALEWERKGKTGDLLLRGSEYVLASKWMEDTKAHPKTPLPTDLQIAYLKESKRVEDNMLARQKMAAKKMTNRLRIALVALGFAVFTMFISLLLMFWAVDAEEKATANFNHLIKVTLLSARSLDEGETNYEDCSSWLGKFGVRGTYCALQKFVSLHTVSALSPDSIFISGPHLDHQFNFNATNEFAHYNPAFLEWAKTNVLPMGLSEEVRYELQPTYDQYFKVLTRIYYIAYKQLEADSVFKKQVVEAYQERLDNYVAKPIPEGQSDDYADWDQRPGTVFVNQFNDFSITLEQQGFDWLGGDDWLHALPAGGFWIRRSMDGTDAAFFTILEQILSVYDPSFIEEYQQVSDKNLLAPAQ